jgi:thiamine-phosphate pyrophosphorylase
MRCYITDRLSLPPGETLLESIRRNLLSGPDWIQIREKDLSANELYEIVLAAMALPNPRGVKVLVNTRVDVALAAGADGAHLPAGSPSPSCWMPITPPGFLFGVSCHTIRELRQAEDGGATYALFGPVFAPLSKTSALAPRGLRGLTQAAKLCTIPVVALGGVTNANAPACLAAGAAGVAGISLFQREPEHA